MALASLTACGDKTTIVQPTTSTQGTGGVQLVTVTPATATLKVGDQITLGASVSADAGVTDRTVTWSTSNAAIATVDAAAGTVKAIAPGTATITAASKADPNQKGTALITVNGGAEPVVTVSTINQTNGFNSVPANLGNVAGQLDVTLNVDPGTRTLAGIDLVMNCATGTGNSGKDTVVATQNLAATAIAAEGAAAPVTLSFNTAMFDSTTGAPRFFNGNCTIKGQARTTAGTTVATNGTAITLNNQDVVVGSITSTQTASDAAGLAWHGGNVTITSTPVFYSGRVPASTTISFEGKKQTVTGTGTKTVTFVDNNDPGNAAKAANDIEGITDPAALPSFTMLDASGNNVTTNPCFIGGLQTFCTSQSVLAGAPVPIITTGASTQNTNPFRLDTQAPLPGTFNLANNTDQGTTLNGYVGANFRFASDSAAGYRGPNATAGNQVRNLDAATGTNGVDKVTVVFQYATSFNGTYTTVTTPSGIAETTTGNALYLRMITTDALGNADTSFAGPTPTEFRTVTSGSAAGIQAARFGVDVTAPTVTFVSGPAANSAVNTIGGGAYTFTYTDNLSGTGLIYVAQTRNWNSLSGTQTAPEGVTYTNTGAVNTAPLAQALTDASPCTIGRYNASQAAAGAGAIQVFDRSGAAIGYCTPVPFNGNVPDNSVAAGGYYTTVVIASDEAGNRAPAFMRTILENPTAPTVANIDLPGSITGNSTVSFPASVTETSGSNVGDITSSWIDLAYSGVGITLQYPMTAGPGVAFDNVLTRTTTVTPSISNFAKSLVVSSGTGGVTAAANNASTVTVFAADPAINPATGAPNAGSLAVTLAPSVQLVAGSGSALGTNFTGGLHDSLSATPGAVNAAVGSTITLNSVATGTTGIFANPFSGGAVSFWYRPTGSTGPWFYITSTTSGVTQDDGTQRSWIYTGSFTIPSVAPDGTVITSGSTINIRSIGVNSVGDAVTTAGTATITVP